MRCNSNLSYVIGLLTADGNLSSDGRHITFVSKDLDLIHIFKKGLGLTPNKSKTIKNLLIPDRYFSDFLRGLIDGDGTIGYFMHPESKQKQFRIRIASGSRDFLEWLKREINKFLGTKGSIRQVTRAYELCYYTEASRKLRDFIYYRNDIFCLRRKFEIAKLMKCGRGGIGDTRTA